MKQILLLFIVFFLQPKITIAQVLLDANGPGSTYELINSVLAPNYNVIEAPDCNHEEFGRHIDEIFDADLNINVFQFKIHTTPDNDRCINFDRQRNEIKTYDKSPDNLLGIVGETVVYKWKFKLPEGFQSSSSFTHIHQLKSVGGSLEDMPMYTLTTRKGSPDKLELRYAVTDSQITLKSTDLTPFKGVWVEATETINYGTNGTYAIEIKRVSDGSILFNYSNNAIVNWRLDAEFVRPKWGIYRSLNSPADLRDETLLFANFSIEELTTLSVDDSNFQGSNIKIYPNPASSKVFIKEKTSNSFNAIVIFDKLGRILINTKPENDNTIDISNLNTGIYFLTFKKDNTTVGVEKLIIN